VLLNIKVVVQHSCIFEPIPNTNVYTSEHKLASQITKVIFKIIIFSCLSLPRLIKQIIN